VEVVTMYGLTRATLTLIGVAAAGVLLWLATAILPDSVSDASLGGYWAAFGLVALGGLAMALSQLLGGWTKWGWPRVSGNVFLLAFLPALVAGGWILAAHEPSNYWLGRHVRSWSGDIGIDGFVDELGLMIPAIAFGIGLVFGLTFDTTGPRIPRKMQPVPAGGAQPRPAVDGGGSAEEDRRVQPENGDTPEPAERPAEPAKS
jgi:MFS family permease